MGESDTYLLQNHLCFSKLLKDVILDTVLPNAVHSSLNYRGSLNSVRESISAKGGGVANVLMVL